MTEPHVVTTVVYTVHSACGHHFRHTDTTLYSVMGGETKHVYPVLSLYILNMDGLHFFEALTTTIVFILGIQYICIYVVSQEDRQQG